MITEDYVSFETAKLLKEKGFDIPYDSFRGVYINGVFKRLNPGAAYGFNDGDEIVDVCSLQLAMKWLREEHGLFPVIEPFLTEETKPKYWVDVIWHNSIPKYMQSKLNYYTPEEACESAIRYCLKNLI